MSDANETNLKPCPFCGASASMRHGSRFSHWVQCDKCGAGHPFAFDTEAEAAAAWNRRATEAEGNQATQEEPSSGANPDAETVADIRAWLANGEVARCLAAITDTDAMHDMLTAVADRIEAALAREREMSKGLPKKLDENRAITGDAAAMRNALIVAKANFDSMGANALEGELNLDAVAMICASMSARMDAALSAPARNCDRYGDEDDAFAAWHDALNDGDVVSVRNAFAWLFAKAEGGAE